MEPHDLYGLPLERFTAERNALAKELRKRGRRDEAARISELRKPSIAAWAVNQLVRTQRREVADLFAAGDALRNAQETLLVGRGEADALRDAVEAERAAIDRLTEKARGLLSAEGHELTPATVSKVAETLNAAALDRDVRPEVEGGSLVTERHHVGLGSLDATAGGRSNAARRRSPASKRSSKRGGAAPRGRAAQARSTQSREARKTQSREARKTESEARHRAERSARELETAESRRDRAAAALRDAQAGLRSAEEAVARAQGAAAEAAHRLEELRRRTRKRG